MMLYYIIVKTHQNVLNLFENARLIIFNVSPNTYNNIIFLDIYNIKFFF